MKYLRFIMIFLVICINIYSQEAVEAVPEKLFKVFESNIFNYFNLDDKYTTELQRHEFMKTPDGKNYADKLNKIRNNAYKRRYFIKLDLSELGDISMRDYNLEKKRFYIHYSILYCRTLGIRNPSHIVNKDFYFDDLSFEKINYESPVLFEKLELVYIEVESTKIALEIEKNRSDIEAIIFFDLKNPCIQSFEYCDHLECYKEIKYQLQIQKLLLRIKN